MAVGIITVVLVKFGGDTETENQYIQTSIVNIKVGNTPDEPSGNKQTRV